MRHLSNESAPAWQRFLLVLAAVLTAGVMFVPSVAPASVEEMYKRLPKPEQPCEDPVLGVWIGLAEVNAERYRLTMRVESRDRGLLSGEISADYWGPPSDEPPTCDEPGDRRSLIVMPAEGSYEEGSFAMIGQSWQVAETYCGPEPAAYAPDAFVGDGPSPENNNRMHVEWYGAGAPVRSKAALLAAQGTWRAGELEMVRIACLDAPEPLPALPPREEPVMKQSSCGCL